jgi:hypothetical protein
VGKHTNPQWAGDSREVYFVADHDGIANIYSMQLGSGAVRQVTNVRTGVTGISSLTPAFSLATNADRLAFSAFRDGNYDIFLIDSRDALSGDTPRERWPGRLAAALPPRGEASGDVAAFLGRPQLGLPGTGGFETTDYKPSLSLDYIAPPSISTGISSFGTAVLGGGTALYWSDLLGHHTLMTSFQTTSATSGEILNNLSAVAGYQNQKTRWNWGFFGGQTPFLTGGYRTGIDTVEGEQALIEEVVSFWQIDRNAVAVLSYPFNRARRIEFAGGFRSIAFDAKSYTAAYDLQTGLFLGDATRDLPTADTINMGTLTTAMVFDTSIFGGTSPIMGTRYRLELGGATGGLTYTSALADFRRYLRVSRWLTLAGRLMHYGRYGGDAEDRRFQDIFLGYPSLIRGYTVGSFEVRECGSAADAGCPAFDQLFGIAGWPSATSRPVFPFWGHSESLRRLTCLRWKRLSSTTPASPGIAPKTKS